MIGYAAVAHFGYLRKEWAESEEGEHVTNNQAELLAIKLGASRIRPELRPRTRLVINSDSEWSINSLKLLLGQPSTYKKVRQNLGLLREIAALLSEFGAITFQWVRGHAGNEENERCDKLAKQAVLQRLAEIANAQVTGRTT